MKKTADLRQKTAEFNYGMKNYEEENNRVTSHMPLNPYVNQCFQKKSSVSDYLANNFS